MSNGGPQSTPHGMQPASLDDDGSSRQRTIMLVMLTLIYVLNYLDRQIVVILQEPIKQEFKLLDWQLGLLSGASISILYTACGIPIARWIDRGANRVKLIAVITTVWSVMTALCGLSRDFTQFIIARMGVGLAEAGFTPASHSLLSDMYPLRKRPMAMAIFALGVPIGIMLGLSIGGIVAEHYNWRTALLLVGLPGVLVALVFRLIAREPKRGASEAEPQQTVTPMAFREAFRTLMSRPAYVHVVLGSAASAFVTAGILSWTPSFLIRVHDFSLAEAGLGLGLLAGVSGLVGTMLGGWQASRLGRHGLHAMLWVPTAAIVISMPLMIFAFASGSSSSILWLLLLPMTLTGMWSAPSITLTQTLAPVAARATASAIYIVGANLIGVAMGPMFTGILSDIFGSLVNDEALGLRYALVAMVGVFLWAIVHWLLATRALLHEKDAGAAADIAAMPAS